MSSNNPVIWSEGMFLRPQHFQQQSRYYEGLLEARCGKAISFLWGFLDLALDESILALGKLGVARATGVFPDGTPFDLPSSHPVPPYYEPEVHEREALAGRLVYLGLPLRKPNVPVVAADEHHTLARLRRDKLELGDETRNGGDPETIFVGHLNISILIEGQDLSDYAYLAVARIKEVAANGPIALDDSFIPPALDVKTSNPLAEHLTALQGLIRYHADVLAHQVVAPGRGGTGELSDFLKLQVLNRYEPLVNHLAKLDLLHPELLYRHMLTLLGDLVTFAERSKRGGDYPDYRHDLPEIPFRELMDRLRDALSKASDRKAMQLEIVERAYSIRTVAIPDEKLVRKGRFVLAAKGHLPPERLSAVFDAQVKVAPVDEIAYVVRQNLTGIPIKLIPHRPEEIPYHEGFVYFGLDRFHELWKKIATASEFAFFVGGKTPGLELEMWVIKEDN